MKHLDQKGNTWIRKKRKETSGSEIKHLDQKGNAWIRKETSGSERRERKHLDRMVTDREHLDRYQLWPQYPCGSVSLVWSQVSLTCDDLPEFRVQVDRAGQESPDVSGRQDWRS